MERGLVVLRRQFHHFFIGLIACIPIGIGVLLVDHFWVRRGTAPVEERLAEVAEKHGLTLEYESDLASALQEVLERFPEITGNAHSVGPVLWKEEAGYRLLLFEYEEERRFMRVRQGNVRRNIQGDVGRFGMVVQLAGLELPRWSQAGGAEPPAPPWTAEAVQRARAIDDLLLGMEGETILAVSRPERYALGEAMDRRRAPEFYTGLLGGSLHIDVQRVLDVVNLMQTGSSPLPRFYNIELPKIEIATPSVDAFQERMEESRRRRQEEMEERRQALRDQSEARQREIAEEMETRRAEQQARMDAQRIEREQQAEARRQQWEADRAERAAALEAQQLERERRTQQMIAEREARNAALIESTRLGREEYMRDLQGRLDEAMSTPSPPEQPE